MKQLIVSFMHVNYQIGVYGTEKYVRELSKVLLESEFSHICFFSVKLPMGINKIGCIYNDKFIGIYNYNDIVKVIDYHIQKDELMINSIHLQHLYNHRLDVLRKIIHRYKVPVYYFVHDYYLFCTEYKLVNNKGEFCGLSRACKQKCYNCKYRKKGIRHSVEISNFFKSIKKYIKSIVCPSRYVADSLMEELIEYKDKIVVRPHLVFEGMYIKENNNRKIRLAYLGSQNNAKGYEEWKKIIDNLDNNIEIFYFGTGKEMLRGVNNIYVSNVEQGENSMINNIRDYNIDIVFLWPRWPETYSYVYYEASASNAVILTNNKSGNICDEVNKYKNGKVFESLDDCKEWIISGNLNEKICEIRKNSKFSPEKIKRNSSIKELVSTSSRKIMYDNKTIKIHKNILFTLLFKIRHFKFFTK